MPVSGPTLGLLGRRASERRCTACADGQAKEKPASGGSEAEAHVGAEAQASAPKVITPGADAVDQGYLVQRSGRSVFLLQEEPQHLAAGVRPARVGVRPGWAAARPGVASSMKHPLLEDGTPARVSLDGAGVGGPALRLPAAH